MNKVGALCWKIEKVISKSDYNYAIVRMHPKATKHGYVLQHRIIVENHLGRILGSNEIVHHVNGDKKDNRILNLKVMTSTEHAYMHQLDVGRQWVLLKCPHCGQLFERDRRNTFLAKKKGRYTCCSRSCMGSFHSKVRKQGTTIEVQNAISENIQKEFKKFLDNAEATQSQGAVETIRILPEMVKT